MNVITNYGVNYSKFNQKINNESQKTSFETPYQPAFKSLVLTEPLMKSATQQTKHLSLNNLSEKLAALWSNSKIAKKIKAKRTAKEPEQKEPTPAEKFNNQARLVHNTLYFGFFDKWTRKLTDEFEKNPEEAAKILDEFIEVSKMVYSDGLEYCNHPNDAYSMAQCSVKYPHLFSIMISMPDDSGNLRFTSKDFDIDYMETFAKKPNLFLKYANMNFDVREIVELIELSETEKIPQEDINYAINMKRKTDNSRVFENAPTVDEIKMMKDHPAEFEELANLCYPQDISEKLIEAYKNHPEEVKQLLGIIKPKYIGDGLAENYIKYPEEVNKILNLSQEKITRMGRSDHSNAIIETINNKNTPVFEYLKKYPESLYELSNNNYCIDEIEFFINHFCKGNDLPEIPTYIVNRLVRLTYMENEMLILPDADSEIRAKICGSEGNTFERIITVLSQHRLKCRNNQELVAECVNDIDAFQQKYNFTAGLSTFEM